MADDDGEPQNPLKRFRGDYGPSADEEQQSNPPDDEVEPVNEHRSPQQPTDEIYFPESSATQYPLRFPDDCADEGYLVLRDPEAEETVKSKPRRRGATAKRRPSETTTTTTTDDSLGDAGVTMESRSKPRQRSTKRSRTLDPSNGTGDDDTGSETGVIVKSSAGEL